MAARLCIVANCPNPTHTTRCTVHEWEWFRQQPPMRLWIIEDGNGYATPPRT